MRQDCRQIQRAQPDRSRSRRTFEYRRVDHGRRHARRTYLFDEVFWCGANDAKFYRGILVGLSATGLALVTEHHHAVREGMQITPSTRNRNCRWRAPVIATRVDRLSDMLDLVAAEYPDRAPAVA